MTMKTKVRNPRIPPLLATLPPLETRTLGCTILEAAGYLGVGINTIYKLIAAGELDTYAQFGKRLIKPRSVARLQLAPDEQPPLPKRRKASRLEALRDTSKATAARWAKRKSA
jgi:excisionase family DNA binding protein